MGTLSAHLCSETWNMQTLFQLFVYNRIQQDSWGGWGNSSRFLKDSYKTASMFTIKQPQKLKLYAGIEGQWPDYTCFIGKMVGALANYSYFIGKLVGACSKRALREHILATRRA